MVGHTDLKVLPSSLPLYRMHLPPKEGRGDRFWQGERDRRNQYPEYLVLNRGVGGEHKHSEGQRLLSVLAQYSNERSQHDADASGKDQVCPMAIVSEERETSEMF